MWKYPELPLINHHKADRYQQELYKQMLKIKRFEEMRDMYEEGEYERDNDNRK